MAVDVNPGNDNAGVNTPDINPKSGKPRLPAIKDAQQAWDVISNLKQENVGRNTRNARIMAKYNAEKPWRTEALVQDGLAWKSNFSTQPLATLIDRVGPRFTNAVDSIRYLTSSKLPEHIDGASAKTEAFRREITNTIRARPDWRDFVAELSQENALFGYTAAGWTNEYNWFPKHFRQDVFYIPAGTKQCSQYSQIVVFVESLLLHEFFDRIGDRDAAEAAGWKWENAIDALNNAMPDKIRSRNGDTARIYEDLVREANVGAAHVGGAKTVILNHLFVAETDSGRVSHWILDDRSQKELFHRDEQFESMADVATFFSFQQAGGTMHGSKGIGRQVYAMAGIIDRTRNEVVDRLALAGKLVVQGDEKSQKRFKLSVIGNAILVDRNFEISERKIDGNVEPFFKLDEFMNQRLDEIAGNTSARKMPLQGERPTAAQVNLIAAREEENKDNVITRFLSQFSTLISTMQRKMCHPQVFEQDAKDMQERLLKVMSREELDLISGQRSADVVKDYSDIERQMVIMVCTENQGNPLYNQKELARRKVTAQVDDEFADAVLLPEPDPTDTAEQARLQKMELMAMSSQLQAIEVSPRDGHRVHLDLLKEAIEKALPWVAEDPGQLPAVMAYLDHAKLHVTLGTQAGGPADNYSADAAWIQMYELQLKPLVAHEQAVEQALAQGATPEQAAQIGAEAAAQAAPQAPPQATQTSSTSAAPAAPTATA